MLFQQFKKRREELRLTQLQLAQKCRLNLATIQKIETGAVSPRWENVQTLSRRLGLHVEIVEKTISPDHLAAISVPLTAGKTLPPLLDFSKVLLIACLHFEGYPERVQEALRAFALALKIHYPSRFKQLATENKRLPMILPPQVSGRIVKLSRLAEANLAKVL